VNSTDGKGTENFPIFEKVIHSQNRKELSGWVVMSILQHLPEGFGFVPASLLVSFGMVVSLGGSVMKGRKEHGVEYPALYASVVKIDGKVHTDAKDEGSALAFNCAQRGHQNAMETHYAMMVLTVVGGLAAPRAAALSLFLYSLGAMFYSRNYCSGDPKKRNNGLAFFKYLGLLGLVISNLYLSFLLFQQ